MCMEKKTIKNTVIGNKLARSRQAKGISARALSLELGFSDNYISQIESGYAKPSYNVMMALSEYFDIKVADLFDDKTEYPIQYKELIEELNKLDSQELEKVVDFVKLITNHKK